MCKTACRCLHTLDHLDRGDAHALSIYHRVIGAEPMDTIGCFLLIIDDSGLTFPYLLGYCCLMFSRMHFTLIPPLQ